MTHHFLSNSNEKVSKREELPSTTDDDLGVNPDLMRQEMIFLGANYVPFSSPMGAVISSMRKVASCTQTCEK